MGPSLFKLISDDSLFSGPVWFELISEESRSLGPYLFEFTPEEISFLGLSRVDLSQRRDRFWAHLCLNEDNSFSFKTL